MTGKTTAFLLILIFAVGGHCFAYGSDELLLITGDFPPYSFDDNGRITGIATEIINELMARAGHDGKIRMLPWNRAQAYSTRYKMMLFPYVRSRYREEYFKWIGPIMRDRLVFVVPRSNTQTFASIDAFKHLRIGFNDSTPNLIRLKEIGFQHLQAVPTERQNARKLVLGNRIDAWFAPFLIIKHTLKSMGIDDSEIRIAFQDKTVDMYIGASLKVPDETVDLWQSNLLDMKSDGTYQRIIKTVSSDE